ncbi:hypothetical protein, partial [Ruminococcus bicirculans (ex Wegman et al. 2014)]|uniref:hypothetical protein n=1 Tax=Ruminococcus bicirculans (ex Wegman et al. 2014) TaxID=1160721 RepID=UPI003FEEB2CA
RPHKPSGAGLERALYLSLRSVLGGSFAHSSFLIPHSSLLTPHLNSPPPLIFPVICSIINEIVHNNRKILTERIFIKWK